MPSFAITAAKDRPVLSLVIACQFPVEDAEVLLQMSPLSDDVYIPPPFVAAAKNCPALSQAIERQFFDGADVWVHTY
jgi:hypothetical protein